MCKEKRENQHKTSHLFPLFIEISICLLRSATFFQLYSLQGGMGVTFLSVSHLAKRQMLKDLWTDQCQGWDPQFPANSIFLEKRLPVRVVFTCKQSQRSLKCWLEQSWTFRRKVKPTGHTHNDRQHIQVLDSFGVWFQY